jgi:hypothetical protein
MKKILLVAGLVLLAGCSGLDLKPSLPAHINKLAVPTFKNATGQPSLEQDLTQKVVQGFIVDGRLSVAAQDKADALLEGVVQNYQKIPLVRDINQVPQQYKLTVSVDLTFTDLTKQQRLWTTLRTVDTDKAESVSSTAYDSTNIATLTEYTTYYVINNLGMPAEDETTARLRVLDQLTRRIVNRTLYGF